MPTLDKIEMMEENASGCPTTLNLTLSVKKRKIVLFMFGASVRSGIATQKSERKKLFFNNKLIAESRVKAIPALSNVVLIRREPRLCDHLWGNCSESVPWQALHGRK